MSTSRKEPRKKQAYKEVAERSTAIVATCIVALVILAAIDAFAPEHYETPEIINLGLLGMIVGEKFGDLTRKRD